MINKYLINLLTWLGIFDKEQITLVKQLDNIKNDVKLNRHERRKLSKLNRRK